MGRHPDVNAGVRLGLLTHLVLRAGDGRPGRAAGQMRPRPGTCPAAGTGPDAALPRGGSAGRDPRHQPRPGLLHHRGDRPGRVPLPRRRTPGVMGRAVPPAASPDPALAPPRRTTATAGCAATSARPPPAPRSAPPPSSANTTGGSPAVAEGQSPGRRRPLHPDHHLLLSDPPPGTPTSASATTRHALTPTGRSATTSASSKPSASRSPLPKPPDPYRSDQAQRRTRPGSARPAEMSYFRVSSLRIRSIPSVPEPPGMRICEQKFYNTIKKNSVRM